MKVISLHPQITSTPTQDLFTDILKKDLKAFKASSAQFIRNNKGLGFKFLGIIA